MEFIRKVNLSLHYNLKYNILSNYIESESSNLEFDEQLGMYKPTYDYTPNAGGRGRGVYPFDTIGSGIFSTCCEGSYIKVYHSTGEISSSNYNINYKVPGVTLVSGTDIPAMFEYKWNYVSVIDEWPYVNVPELPFILLDWKKFNSEGFQLGGGKKHICNLDVLIFGSSKPELDDLTYIVHDGLYNKCLTVFDFSGGDVFDWSGEFNDFFNCDHNSEIPKVEFNNVSVNYLNLPVDFNNDLNAYRSKVSLEIFAYKEA